MIAKKMMLTLGVLALCIPVIAYAQQGQPFQSLQKQIDQLQQQINNLQTQITNIQLTPGPPGKQGPKGDTGPAGPQGPAGTIPQDVLTTICQIAKLNSDHIPCPTVCDCSRIVFISSSTYSGNLGGLSGADAKCQLLAEAAGFVGLTFKAWLSAATEGPATRFYHSLYPYRRVDGVVVANNWDDLVDGRLQAPINIDENGQPVPTHPQYVWSGTYGTGEAVVADVYHGAPKCYALPTQGSVEWSSDRDVDSGLIGHKDMTDERWTNCTGCDPRQLGVVQSCDGQAHMYCFEQ